MPVLQRIHTATSTGFPPVRNGSGPIGVTTPASQGADTIEKTSCSYQEQTFFGDFCVSGRGADTAVCFHHHHHGQELEAKVGNASFEAAVETLLQEMVLREAIAVTDTTGSSGKRHVPDCRDMDNSDGRAQPIFEAWESRKSSTQRLLFREDTRFPSGPFDQRDWQRLGLCSVSDETAHRIDLFGFTFEFSSSSIACDAPTGRSG